MYPWGLGSPGSVYLGIVSIVFSIISEAEIMVFWSNMLVFVTTYEINEATVTNL